MGLHETLSRDILWGHAWYQAHYARAGMSHAFSVPFIRKTNIIMSPGDMNWYGPAELERYLEAMRERPTYRVPGHLPNREERLRLIHAERLCRRSQDAYDWELNGRMFVEPHTLDQQRPRATCETCWNRMCSLTPRGRFPAGIDNIHYAPTPSFEETFDDWVGRVSGRVPDRQLISEGWRSFEI